MEKSSSTGPSASSKHSFPSLLYANIPSNKNLSPKCPKRFLVDFSYQTKLSRTFHVTVSAKKLTVTSFSRSREGSVDGAKCSFLRTHCLMIFSLSRMEPTLDSGVPDEVRAVFDLEKIKDRRQKALKDNIHLECSPLWGPSPSWHLECIDKE